MDDNGIKVKTLEYTASRKKSFEWSFKDDILHYDTTHTLASIQPAPIGTVSSELRNTSLRNFHCRCQLGNKGSRYSFKQNVLNFPNLLWYNFSKDEMFEEETLSSKNTAKFKDFTMSKCTSSGFFCQSNFVLKEF